MQAVCPITEKRIDEKVARLNALFTVAMVMMYFLFGFWPVMLFMAIDFFIRGFVDSKYSPVCQMNKWNAKGLGISPKIVNAGPKIFAAQVGFVLTFVSSLAYFFNILDLTSALMIMLGVFSFLEAAFGICVACKLYPFLRKR